MKKGLLVDLRHRGKSDNFTFTAGTSKGLTGTNVSLVSMFKSAQWQVLNQLDSYTRMFTVLLLETFYGKV